MTLKVYRSSAGSGKTYTLVKEFLKLCLNQRNAFAFKEVLAITFTNKASSEMKKRLIETLDETVNSKELPSIAKDVCLELNIDEAKLKESCSKVLTSILHNYGSLSISTIDKFMHKLIRSFSYDLDLPAGFEITTDSKSLLINAIENLINKAGTDTNLTKILLQFSEWRAEEQKSFSLEDDLLLLSEKLLSDDSIKFYEKLKEISPEVFFENWDIVQKRKNKYLDELTIYYEEGKKILNTLPEPKNLCNGEYGFPSFFKKLSKRNLIFSYLDDLENKNLNKSIENENYVSGKIPEAEFDKYSTAGKKLAEIYLKIQNWKDKNSEDFILCNLISQTIFTTAIINEVAKEYQIIKKDNSILPINEFNFKISEVIKKENAPFIFEKIGNRYNNLMIDEFQDTSVLQWNNFLPLIENSLATSNFNLLVGDSKQSIYRWRGADVEQFSNLPKLKNLDDTKENKVRESFISSFFSESFLDKNYRSKKNIIDFNNAFFDSSRLNLDTTIKSIYQNHFQLQGRKFEDDGYVQMEFAPEKSAPEKLSREELNLWYCQRTLKIIRECLNDGYQLADIAILVRKNDIGNVIVNYLNENKVPVISKESLLLSFNIHVQFVINIVNCIYFKNNKVALLEISKYLCNYNEGKESLEQLSLKINSISLNYVLKNFDFELNVSTIKNLPLFESLEYICGFFGLLKKPDAFVLGLLEVVIKFSKNTSKGLIDFIEWFNQNSEKLSVVLPDSMEAVTVLTIHKSKGLQFPVVIIPELSWNTASKDKFLWMELQNGYLKEIDTLLIPNLKIIEHTFLKEQFVTEKNKNILDHLNMLYVAFTRAEERLYGLLKCPPKKGAPLELNFVIESQLFNFCSQLDGIQKVENGFSLGIPLKKNKKSINRIVGKLEPEFFSNYWGRTIKLSSTKNYSIEEESTTYKVEVGNAIHKVLEFINCKEDLAQLDSLLEKELILKNQKEYYKNEIQFLVKESEIAFLFERNYKVLSEFEIFSEGGILRPDKLIMKDQEYFILDFKTGMENKNYKLKQEEYCKALVKLNFPIKSSIIYYIKNRKVETVSYA